MMGRIDRNRTNYQIILKYGLVMLPLLFLEAARAANGADFSWLGLVGRFGFTLAILILAWVSNPIGRASGAIIFPSYSLGLPGLVVLAGVIYWIWGGTWAAWLLCGTVLSLLLVSTELAPSKWRWMATGAISLVAGTILVAMTQIETRFAEEEFYALVQVVLLATYWLLLSVVYKRGFPNRNTKNAPNQISIPIMPTLVAIIVLGSVGIFGTLRAYQSSFYPTRVPVYPEITEADPFLCGQVQEEEQVYLAADIYNGMLERVVANPLKEAPDLALLALGTKDAYWLDEYRTSILKEAHSGAFSGPANSIKYGQYQAALRIYYYIVMRQAFPDLFTVEQEDLLHSWFTAINRRAQTVEWVDWMYAIAFRMQPKGPYENQETGAGLLSLLESQRLGDASLSKENQAYLAERGGGWEAGFRNSDDAIIYQPEWIHNAFFQSIYAGSVNIENAQRSFEWLLLQSPPNGSPLSYNHVGPVYLAPPAYLGAQLVEDDRLLWLAGRSLDYLVANNLPLSAKPGMEQVLAGTGSSPKAGTCLIYGSSGVPTQTGPLAPDKIVFRDGWSEDASYVLLNLRFSGWHRYKATNAIVLLAKSGALVKEATTGQTLAWLPAGRSLFRDKRLPRENLNGLVIQRSGLSSVIHELTGVGSQWAQDPPAYAAVERFETQPGYDFSSSVIEDWHGWKHQRSIHFYHQGPVVVIDTAKGRAGDQSALIWHTTSSNALTNNRLKIRDGADPAEMVLVPLQAGQVSSRFTQDNGNRELRLEFQPSDTGSLALATVFLTGKWTSAQVNLVDVDGQPTIQIVNTTDEILLPVQEMTDD
jgi:hypothetical protein